MTRGAGPVAAAAVSCAVAARPSSVGIRTSMSTTSTAGSRRASSRTACGAVAGLDHDLEVGLGVDDHAEPGAHQLLVVDEGDADRLVGHRRGLVLVPVRGDGGVPSVVGAVVRDGRRRPARPGRRQAWDGWERTRKPPPGRGPAVTCRRTSPLARASRAAPDRCRRCPPGAATVVADLHYDARRPPLTTTVTVGSGPACLSTLVSASCAIR